MALHRQRGAPAAYRASMSARARALALDRRILALR